MINAVRYDDGSRQLPQVRWMLTAIAMVVTACFIMTSIPAQAASGNKPLRIAVSLTPLSAPFIVAIEKGYFAEFGIDPIVTNVIGGHRAAKVLLSGNADLATSSETVVMFNSFDRTDFGILCSFVSSDNDVKILTRTDSNIRTLSDLTGRRVGATKGTSAQFFLDHALTMSQFPAGDIEVVNINPEEAATFLESGIVDAVTTWEPFGYLAKKKMGNEVVQISHDHIYVETFNAIVLKEFAINNPDILESVLKALIKATEFIFSNENDAKIIVSNYLKTDPEIISAIWGAFVFGITLDQSLISSLEAEARWAIKESLVNAKYILEIEDAFQILEGHVEQQTDAARQ